MQNLSQHLFFFLLNVDFKKQNKINRDYGLKFKFNSHNYNIHVRNSLKM